MTLLLKLLGSKVGAIVALVALAGLLVAIPVAYQRGGDARGQKDELAAARALQAALAKRDAQHKSDLTNRDQSDRLTAAGLTAQNAELQNQLAVLASLPPKVLVRTQVVDHGCPVASLSPDFWSLYRAAGVPSPAPVH